jgi:hypothetical protein
VSGFRVSGREQSKIPRRDLGCRLDGRQDWGHALKLHLYFTHTTLLGMLLEIMGSKSPQATLSAITGIQGRGSRHLALLPTVYARASPGVPGGRREEWRKKEGEPGKAEGS